MGLPLLGQDGDFRSCHPKMRLEAVHCDPLHLAIYLDHEQLLPRVLHYEYCGAGAGVELDPNVLARPRAGAGVGTGARA